MTVTDGLHEYKKKRSKTWFFIASFVFFLQPCVVLLCLVSQKSKIIHQKTFVNSKKSDAGAKNVDIC